MSKFKNRQQYFHHCRELLWNKRLKIARNYLTALHKQGKLKELPTDEQVKLQVMQVLPYPRAGKACHFCRNYRLCLDWATVLFVCALCFERRANIRFALSLPTIELCLFDNGKTECDMSVLNCLPRPLCLLIVEYL